MAPGVAVVHDRDRGAKWWDHPDWSDVLRLCFSIPAFL